MDLVPEHNLLRLLTYVNPDEIEQKQINQAIVQITDWQYWYERASFNKIVPICFRSLLQLNLKHCVPEPIWLQMEQEANLIRTKNELRNTEAVNFLNEFKKNDIPVALLKGVAFGETVYGDASYKRMNDIDILVKKENIDTIYSIYDRLGYWYVGERIGGSKEKSDKVSHLSPPFVSKNCHCVIGTQWGIKSPLSSYPVNYEKLWNRVLPLNFMGIDILMLSPEDNMHHLCLHLGYFKISLRDMMDFYNLLRATRDQFDWNLFYEIVEESNSQNPVYFGLAISQFICPIPGVEVFLHRIENKVSTQYKKAVKWKTRSWNVFLNLHSDHIQTVEKTISVFDSTSYFPEKLRYFLKIWKCIIWPPENEIVCMSALYKPNFFKRFMARTTIPFKIIRVIVGEVGWFVFIFISTKTFVTVIISFAKFPFVSKHRSDIGAYAEKLGVPLEKLIELQEQFQ